MSNAKSLWGINGHNGNGIFEIDTSTFYDGFHSKLNLHRQHLCLEQCHIERNGSIIGEYNRAVSSRLLL